MGAGWIERELAAVKRSYEEEVRVLDAEISELRAKLRQTTSYSAELRRRYEDSMKSVFRLGLRCVLKKVFDTELKNNLNIYTYIK